MTEHWGVSVSSDGKKLLTLEWQNRSNIWKIPGGKSELAQPISRNIHANYRAIAVAPDGRIVYPSNEDADGNRDLWIMNADGTGEKKLTNKQGGNILPCVTRDGRYIIIASNRGDLKTYHIWRMNLDGSDPKQLTFGASERGPFCPPDPSFVYFHTGTPAQGMKVSRIGRVSIDGGEPEILTDYPSARSDISPDGRFIASTCIPEPKSKPKICIIPVEGGKPEKTFDLEQLSYLRWRPDGSAVTFTKTIDGVSNFWDQPVDGGPQTQFTNFAAEWVQLFQWSANGDLYCSRGYEIRDPIVITNFQ
jgi:WD40 repeat protein